MVDERVYIMNLQLMKQSKENGIDVIEHGFHWNLRPATLITKKTLSQVFSCEFSEIFISVFFTEHLWATVSELSKENLKNFNFILMLTCHRANWRKVEK